MLQPLRSNPQRVAKVSGATVPAPIKGWNTIAPLSAMPEDCAPLLDNFIPREGSVDLRPGWDEWATTGETAAVETLMAYQGNNTSNDRLFAAVNGQVFDVTASGTASSAVVSSLSNTRLQHVNFTATGGHFLYFVNGANAPRAYDGSSWVTPTITGATASGFTNLASFKNRLLFCTANKLGFYYLPVDSYQGAATYFELGGVFTQGGYLMAIGTWTVDGGIGIDDHAVFVSSRGQIAIYKGTDPASASTWALVGVFDAGAPLGRRCLLKSGGDMAVTTVQGVVPLSQLLTRDKTGQGQSAITRNIEPTMNSAARSYGDNFGWQLIGYPKGRIAIINVPVQENQTQHQYVMNATTGAWCRFMGINANCWEVFNDDIYFGGNAGSVGKFDSGPTDNGVAITADLATAWNYFGARGSLKRWPMVQPVVVSDGLVSPAVLLNTDFRDQVPSSGGSISNAGSLLWDEFFWDVDDWPTDVSVTTDWQSAAALGQCVSVRLRIVATSISSSPILLQINSFNLVMERGGFI